MTTKSSEIPHSKNTWVTLAAQITQQLVSVSVTANTLSDHVVSLAVPRNQQSQTLVLRCKLWGHSGKAQINRIQSITKEKARLQWLWVHVSNYIRKGNWQQNSGHLQSTHRVSDLEAHLICTWMPTLQPLFLDFFLGFPEALFVISSFSYQEKHTNSRGKVSLNYPNHHKGVP